TNPCSDSHRASPPPRALPPCPTRRSSDLRIEEPQAVIVPIQKKIRQSFYAQRSLMRMVSNTHRAGSHGKAAGLDPSAAKSDRVGDRKSTRLNSSHGSISYAVFCLTKRVGE